VKVEHQAELDISEIHMLRWICGFGLKDSKKNTKVKELLGLEPVSMSITRRSLRWFGRVECKYDSDWGKWWRLKELLREEGTSKEELVGLCQEFWACPVRMPMRGINRD